MKLKITITLLCVLLLNIFSLSAQSEKPKKKNSNREFGINITSLLTDLLGNNNRADIGNYLLSLKLLNANQKSAFRVGATIDIDIVEENRSIVNSTLTNQNFQLRIGKEWRYDIAKRFQYYVGVDGLVGFRTQNSSSSISGSLIIQRDKQLGAGIGPVLGFQFTVYDNLLLGTEGSFYLTANRSNTEFDTFGGQGIPERRSTGIALKTTLPKSLFLILKF